MPSTPHCEHALNATSAAAEPADVGEEREDLGHGHGVVPVGVAKVGEELLAKITAEGALEQRDGAPVVRRAVTLLRALPADCRRGVRGRHDQEHLVRRHKFVQRVVVQVGVVAVDVDNDRPLADDALVDLQVSKRQLERVIDPARRGLAEVHAVATLEELRVEGARHQVVGALHDREQLHLNDADEADDEGPMRRLLEGGDDLVPEMLEAHV
mmetsp:Transcript_37717/g.93623  ORF Transcript_37717/g.93623 Transcript_37717/m.93623 type:complete len:212 (-) Transcript_37717:56-691(-)